MSSSVIVALASCTNRRNNRSANVSERVLRAEWDHNVVIVPKSGNAWSRVLPSTSAMVLSSFLDY